MDTFRVSIEVGDAAGRRYQTVEAIVDTGAPYLSLPTPLLHGLGIVPHARDTRAGRWSPRLEPRDTIPGLFLSRERRVAYPREC